MGSNNFGTLLFGAVIGVGVGLYLNSEEGRRWRKAKTQDLSDFEARIEQKLDDALKEMKGKVNHAATKVKNATETSES